MCMTRNRTPYLAILPHLAGDVVTVLQLVDKSLALVIEEQATDTTESLRSQEFDLRLGVIGVNQTGGVHLDLLEVNRIRTNLERELVPITRAVLAVCCRKVIELRAVLLQERVLREVCGITTSSKDDGAVSGVGLAVVDVLYTDDGIAVADELGHAGLLLDLDPVRLRHGKILQALHLCVGNDLTIGKPIALVLR